LSEQTESKTHITHRLTIAVSILAVVVYAPLFVIQGIGIFDFWWWMAANAVVVLGVVACFDPGWRRLLKDDFQSSIPAKIAIGLASAAVLYAVFFVGNIFSRMILDFAASGIEGVYAFKEGAAPLRVWLLIGLLIGPGEELFWRGFIQRRYMDRFGPWTGLALATALYTLVHVGSLNPMLIIAALLCGLFWGFLFMWKRSLMLVVVSHTVWDIAVFLLWPYS